MNDQEFKSWKIRMMQSPSSPYGRWMIDRIHNGQNGQDLLIYAMRPDNPHSGIFLSITRIEQDAEGHRFALQTGHYSGAGPSISDALFKVKKELPVLTIGDGIQTAYHQLGCSFLMSFFFAANPYFGAKV